MDGQLDRDSQTGQTDRQTDRWIDRQIDGQIDEPTDRQTDRYMDRKIDAIDGWTGTDIDIDIDLIVQKWMSLGVCEGLGRWEARQDGAITFG